MSTVINTNLASLYAQNNLSNAQNNLAQSVQRLSSGLRINNAKDDAAGLAISQNMQAQINGVDQSRRNLNDAVNLMQVAETSLTTIQDMLLRIKQLATQGYDGSQSTAQRTNLVDELVQLNTEINNTAIRSKFNGNSLISNSNTIDTTGTIKNATTFGGMTISQMNVAGAVAGGTYNATYDTASNILTLTNGTNVGSVTLVDTAANSSQVISFANLGISFLATNNTGASIDADTLGATAGGLGGDTLKVTAGTAAVTFQAGADVQAENLITYTTMNVLTNGSGVDSQMQNLGTQITAMAAGAATYTSAQWATAFNTLGGYVDTANNYISDKRSSIGALTNRVGYIMTNLESQSTNLKASKSAILDTDFAAETAKLTKGQIMQQAATAMLAQANQMPNVVLSLLK
ncbi:flagellin N-terminal helical domain-containing protein [Polynucleobacter difficilis]|uniref:flagellin N-terminal helical domain-containing protein n=1 Tax=Polynucleobacter difficilis TaxID=556054 RepID=UPI00131ED338|nr:flagellin [Polynucleobacter difficilis]